MLIDGSQDVADLNMRKSLKRLLQHDGIAASSAVNLIILLMLQTRVTCVTIFDDGHHTHFEIAKGEVAEHEPLCEPIRCDFGRIWTRLSIMCITPLPWHARATVWLLKSASRAAMERGEKIQEVIWRRLRKAFGEYETLINSVPFIASFRKISDRRLELKLAKRVNA
jgi:hypothetical protein